MGEKTCYIAFMNASEIVNRLKALEGDLRSAGLDSLYLFGSRARGDYRPESDVDLAFDVAPSADLTFSLLDQAGLNMLLAEALGTKVDFVERRALRPRLREQVELDSIAVF